MKKGEVGILSVIGVAVVIAALVKVYSMSANTEKDKGIPFYSTASDSLSKQARGLMEKYSCRDCHSLWTMRSIMQSVPAPALDGLGSLKSEEWFFNYFSAEIPQKIVPTRLKKEFQMPSLANATETERQILAKYLASLKVKDWYLEETKKREFEKLTGKKYQP